MCKFQMYKSANEKGNPQRSSRDVCERSLRVSVNYMVFEKYYFLIGGASNGVAGEDEE